MRAIRTSKERKRLRASFMRGGTSKALLFVRENLPVDQREWDSIFLAAMGSPDVYGRQLNGMGGGYSSLSKVCIVGKSERKDADVDYTFAQVQIRKRQVNYDINCGNMSSAIGPFALAAGIVTGVDRGEQLVRIYNTNTKKIIHANFESFDGIAIEDGNLTIPGVDGCGSPIRLDFIDPGGAATGELLPGEGVIQNIRLSAEKSVEVSLIDAANACVFVNAASVGLIGIELPDEIELSNKVMENLEDIRTVASVAMGLSENKKQAHDNTSSPFIVIVSEARGSNTLEGKCINAEEVDVTVRALSNGQPHRALPLTVALCTAVAAKIKGSVVNNVLSQRAESDEKTPIRLGMPSGILQVNAEVIKQNEEWSAACGSFYRTACVLFDGYVYYKI